MAFTLLLLAGCPSWFAKVPGVTGVVLGKAEKILKEAGFVHVGLGTALSASVPAGNVLCQTPPAGQCVSRDEDIVLTVSGGFGCEESPEALIPALRPVTMEQGQALGRYCRKLLVQAGEEPPVPMAWSLVNQACQDRALVLQYAIATASFPLPETPPVMREADLTEEALSGLLANPGIDCASINITGPLITAQRFIAPDGSMIAGPAQRPYWAYHHGVVLNVAGELRVLDLSVQDDPLSISDWTSSFVTREIPCAHMSESLHLEVWVYWLNAMSNWMPGERPLCPCAYTITPCFQFRWDQEPLIEVIQTAPLTMITQTGAFMTICEQDYGLVVDASEIPNILSEYTALNEADLCAWVDLSYCHQAPLAR